MKRTITIEFIHKREHAHKLQKALRKAVNKHAKHIEPRTVHTQYTYKEDS